VRGHAARPRPRHSADAEPWGSSGCRRRWRWAEGDGRCGTRGGLLRALAVKLCSQRCLFSEIVSRRRICCTLFVPGRRAGDGAACQMHESNDCLLLTRVFELQTLFECAYAMGKMTTNSHASEP